MLIGIVIGIAIEEASFALAGAGDNSTSIDQNATLSIFPLYKKYFPPSTYTSTGTTQQVQIANVKVIVIKGDTRNDVVTWVVRTIDSTTGQRLNAVGEIVVSQVNRTTKVPFAGGEAIINTYAGTYTYPTSQANAIITVTINNAVISKQATFYLN